MKFLRHIVSGLLIAASIPAHAAPGDWVRQVVPIAAPAELGVIPLGAANIAPEEWAQQGPGQRIVYNVRLPSLIAVAGGPDGNAPAVILVPGGGFEFLAMDTEGYDVARRLNALGVRVFILKYRTLPMSGGFAGFQDALTQTFVKGEHLADLDRDLPYAVADTQAALRMVRAHAAEWHVDAARVGIVGFSAGAITVLGETQANAPDARPDFVGMIYGPTKTAPVPANAPPLFAAIAADDRFFGKQNFGLIEGWRTSGASVEFHLYSGGGHGFASTPNGTTSDAWFDQFAGWLRASGIIAK